MNDTIKRLPRHDLVFRSGVLDPTYGLPIGDGDTGCLIELTENGLRLHINKSDLWDDVAGETGLFCSDENERLNCLRHGAVMNINFDCPLFNWFYAKDFEARLRLSNALASIRTETPFARFAAEAFASHQAGAICLKLSAHFDEPQKAGVILERWGSRNFWRWYDQMLRDPESGLNGTQAMVRDRCLVIAQRLAGRCFSVAAYLSEVAGLERQHSHAAAAQIGPSADTELTIYICVRVADDPEPAIQQAVSAAQSAAAAGYEALLTAHAREWSDFWGKSYVELPPEMDYIENLWYLNLYYAQSEFRGPYPPHFCNGIWGFQHDYVPWNYYFHFNMQLQVFPLAASNHPELLNAYFALKLRQLPHALEYCKTIKGVDGAFFTDVYDHLGINDRHTPDNCTCGAQAALEMWRHYLYTRDECFKEKYALPVMRQTADFYLNFFKTNEQGQLYPSGTQAYEGTPLYDETITDLATARSLFTALCQALDEKESEKYADALKRLPDYHYAQLEDDEFDGNIILHGLGQGEKPRGTQVLCIGREHEGSKWIRKTYGNPNREQFYGVPDTEFAPLFPSDSVGLADKGSQLFDALYNDMLLHPRAEPAKGMCMGWCMAPIYLARLGMARQLKAHLFASASTWIVHPQGFGMYGPYDQFYQNLHDRWRKNRVRDVQSDERFDNPAWSFRHFDYEALPIIATAVNEMLLQSYDGVIRLFPAVEADFDGAFTLRAQGAFIVHARCEEGSIQAGIESLHGGDCAIVLPEWIAHEPVFLLNGAPVDARRLPHGRETKLVIPTRVGDQVTIQCGCVSPRSITESTPNSDAKRMGQSQLGEFRTF